MVRSDPARLPAPAGGQEWRAQAGGPGQSAQGLRQGDVLHQGDLREAADLPRSASRVTKIPWSPVAMPVRRERRFMSPLHQTQQRLTAGEPHVEASPAGAGAAGREQRRRAPPGGTRVSACRNHRYVAAWRPGPRRSSGRHGRAGRSQDPVDRRARPDPGLPSALPPSTRISSRPAARAGARSASRAPMWAASFRVGMTMEKSHAVA